MKLRFYKRKKKDVTKYKAWAKYVITDASNFNHGIIFTVDI